MRSGNAKRASPRSVSGAHRSQPAANSTNSGADTAPLGGLVGALAVIAGLAFVREIAARAFAAPTMTANIPVSLSLDHFCLPRISARPINAWRALVGDLVVAGAALISCFWLAFSSSRAS
jgi:uncharacterized membrane protein YdcZ (DUF606 family)